MGSRSFLIKLIASVCCAVLLFNSLVCAAAVSGGYSLDDRLTSKDLSGLKSTNLLTGITPSYKGVSSAASTTNWTSKLTDGSAVFSVSLAESQNAELTYDLNGAYTVSSFALWQGNSKTFKKVSYEVYFSCEASALFDGENRVFSWNARQNPNSMGQKISFSKAPEARYLGIKITDTCSDSCDKTDSVHRAASISEIGLWGKSAQKITFDSGIKNGEVVVADPSSVPDLGETVTLKVTPDTDYQIMPGSLAYTTASGKRVLINNRAASNTAEADDGGCFSFVMPAEPIVISAVFVSVRETDFLIGTVDAHLYSEDGTNEIASVNGMRFLTRMYLKNAAAVHSSGIYVMHNGKRRKITEFGTLISRGSAAPDIDSVENNSISGWRVVSYNAVDGSCLLSDSTEQYVDFTAAVATALDDMTAFRAREYTAVGYAILDDGTVAYGGSLTDNTINSMKRCGCGMPDASLYSEYNFESYIENYWEGNTVYNESVIFAEDSQGNKSHATLMYEPLNICSVRSIDLQTEYIEGIDYIVEGKNLVLTENSSIKVIGYDTQYPKYATGTTDWLVTAADSTRYTSLRSLRDYQVAVTYTHLDAWNGSVPSPQLEKLSETGRKLTAGENMKVVFFGDSITAGYEASGQDEYAIDMNSLAETHYKRNDAPYMPSWASLVTTGIKKAWPNASVSSTNRAAPSSDSRWGKNNTNLVTALSPDLVVIAFGMNEADSTASYKSNIISIINSIRQTKPDAEFLLVSAFVPNTAARAFANNKLAVQETLLYEIQSELNDIHIAVAPVNSMCRQLLAMGKKETDGINNNLNHPNDFMIRLYAQTVLAALSDK